MKDNNLLSIDKVGFSYGKKKILDKLSLNVKGGEIVGIIGRNGCGKTTLLKLISGILFPSEGFITTPDNTDNNAPGISGFLETPKLLDYLTGEENLRFYLEKQFSKEKAKQEFERWGISEYANVNVSKYSLGMKQKLGLIIAFLSGSPLMIFDEPTNALDYHSVKTFYSCAHEAQKSGRSIILVTHLLYDLTQNCTRVLEFKDTRLTEYNKDYTCRFYSIEFATEKDAASAAEILTGSEVQALNGRILTVNESERSISATIRIVSKFDILTVTESLQIDSERGNDTK